jgi:hypothetical protein
MNLANRTSELMFCLCGSRTRSCWTRSWDIHTTYVHQDPSQCYLSSRLCQRQSGLPIRNQTSVLQVCTSHQHLPFGSCLFAENAICPSTHTSDEGGSCFSRQDNASSSPPPPSPIATTAASVISELSRTSLPFQCVSGIIKLRYYKCANHFVSNEHDDDMSDYQHPSLGKLPLCLKSPLPCPGRSGEEKNPCSGNRTTVVQRLPWNLNLWSRTLMRRLGHHNVQMLSNY